jgi:hypothetical protein
MAQAESNRVALYHSTEAAFDEVPAAPTMIEVPYSSESLAYDKRMVQSNLVRSDRMIDDIIEVGAGASGDINFEYKFGDFDNFILGALGAAVYTSNTFTGTANLSFAASGGGVQVITGPASTFTNWQDGAWVRVSGANANNNGVWKQTAHTSTTITVANTTGTLQSNTSATVLQKFAFNGTTKKSFLLEKRFNDITQFIHLRGMRVNTWAMNIESEQIITGSFGFTGSRAVAQGTTISGGSTAAGILSVCSATANIGTLMEGGIALATKIKSIKMNVNNNARALGAVASKYPIGINFGSQVVTGTVEAYFEDLTLYNKFINNTDSSLVFEIKSPEDDRTIITINDLEFTSSKPVGQGLNQDVMIALDFTAKRDSTLNAQIQVDLLT